MKREVILFYFGCSEVNSTWLITSELANQRARKALVWYILIGLIIVNVIRKVIQLITVFFSYGPGARVF